LQQMPSLVAIIPELKALNWHNKRCPTFITTVVYILYKNTEKAWFEIY